MLTKAERQEARVTLATTRAGSRYKRELLYSALDSLDEIEEVLRFYGDASNYYTAVGGIEVCKDNGYRARKVLGE